MNFSTFVALFLKRFPYQPTHGQKKLISELSAFILNENKKSLFLLKGYAGTGKTSFVSTLVNVLSTLKIRCILLAPTGRAAKVFATYSGVQAHTIHRFIYFFATDQLNHIKILLRKNKYKNTLFIVDEASMITDRSSNLELTSTSHNLLDDLFRFVYSQDHNCKLILIGDSAQLPPVGLTISPALDENHLKLTYNLDIHFFELKEVVRQSLNSGILANATKIRKNLHHEKFQPPFFSLKNYTDIIQMNGYDLEEAIHSSYSKSGTENTIIITYSNKRANLYNQQIRYRILYREEQISSGDQMMVVKNNYYWLPEKSVAGFIANGDIIELCRIHKIETMYGFQFADVTIRLTDYPEEPVIEVKIMLDTIMSDYPALHNQENKRLFDEIMKDYKDIPSKQKRIHTLKKNPYFNALQVKFSYALTCHKAQGGQWDCVFLDQLYYKENIFNREFLRWLYTAITRASKKLYLVNFDPIFFQ